MRSLKTTVNFWNYYNILSNKNDNLKSLSKLDKNSIAEICKYIKLDSKELNNLERACKSLYKVINSEEFFDFISNEQNLDIKNIDIKDFFKQLKNLRKFIDRNKPFSRGRSKNELCYDVSKVLFMGSDCAFAIGLMGPFILLSKLICKFNEKCKEDKNAEKIHDILMYISAPILLISIMAICYSAISMIKYNRMKKSDYYKIVMGFIDKGYLEDGNYKLLFNSKINTH